MKTILLLVLLMLGGSAFGQAVSRTELRNTNNILLTQIRPKMAGSVTLSNFVSYLTANGITNIAAGTNSVLSISNGTLFIHSTATGGGSSSLTTNGIDVISGTNLFFQNIVADLFTIGLFLPTNTVFISETNAGSAGNYVADFSKSEQTIMVNGTVTFLHATNLYIAPTNAYLCISLINFSGTDQSLVIPVAWKESLNFPTVITNRTILQVALKNYGGLSQSNVLAGAAQF